MSKRKILIIISGIIIFSLFLFVNFINSKFVVPILMYHSVGPNPPPDYKLAVSTRALERQMSFLRRHHYNVLPLGELALFIKLKKKVPKKTVAITFDDGYEDNYIYAFPILKKYNIPVTIFIIVNEVGTAGKLTWDEIRFMQDSGIISFGSHTLGSQPLVDIKSKDELRKQIFDSKGILEERLGREVNAFSYPEGTFNDRIKQLVINAGYKVAVATNPGKRFPNDDIFVLKRLRISSTSNNLFVFWAETSGFYTFIKEHRDDE